MKVNPLQLAILVATAIGVFFGSNANDLVALGISDTLLRVTTSAITAVVGILAALKAASDSPAVAAAKLSESTAKDAASVSVAASVAQTVTPPADK